MAQDPAANAIGAWVHGLVTGAAHAATNFHNSVENSPSLQQGVGDFVRGLIGGPDQMQARVSTPAPKGGGKAPAPAGAQAPVYTQAYLNKQPNFVQQYNAAHPDSPVLAGPAASGPSAPATPFDFVRQAAEGNPGLSLAQMGPVVDAAAKLIPQAVKPVPLTAKEKAIAQYTDLANRYAIATAQDPNYANSQGGKAHAQLMENLRSVASSPNPINDVMTGGLPVQGN